LDPSCVRYHHSPHFSITNPMANGPVPVGTAISSAVPRESNLDSPRKAFCGFQRNRSAFQCEADQCSGDSDQEIGAKRRGRC
jgi:hypothetical protein